MTDDLDLRKQLRALREDRVPYEDLYGLIHEFGEGGFTEAEPDVVRFLKHEDYLLRYIAVSVLTFHWDMPKYRDEFERLLFDDPDEYVRHIAASGLGYVLRESRDPEATRVLLQKLRDTSDDGYVRAAAYEAILDIWFPPPERKREWLTGIRETLERSVVKDEDLSKASARSREDFRKTWAFWEREWELRVDWDLVAAIERGDFPEQRP